MTIPPSDIENSKPLLPPPQFGLRTLLLVVTGCAVIFALSHWLSPIALAGVVMLVLCVVAHVAGNAIGTRLRELGGRPPQRRLEPLAGRQAVEHAPATQLSQRTSLGWPIIVGTAAGTLAGAIGGGVWTVTYSRFTPDIFSLGVGILAFAVLNGIGAFAIVGFLQVGLGALRQAHHTK